MDTVRERIIAQIAAHPVLLYMKGSPDFPRCGFSARVVEVLAHFNTTFRYVDILENPDIRADLPAYANWPTFPQLYIGGTLIGGCDIVLQMATDGELQPLLDQQNALQDQPSFVSA